MKKLLVWMIVLAGGAYLGAKFYLHYRVSQDIDNVILMLSPFADVSYSGVSSTMGGTLSIDDLQVVVNGYRDPIRADKVSIETPGFWHLMSLGDVRSGDMDAIPESLAFSVSGFSSATSSDLLQYLHTLSEQDTEASEERDAAAECTGQGGGFSPSTLRQLGYTEVVADLSVGYRSAAGNVVLDMATSIQDMYDMQVELTLEGAFSPQTMMMGAYRPRMVNGAIEYVDQSIKQRTEQLCERAGLSEEQIHAAMLDAFNAIGEQYGVVFDEQIIEPYEQFLAGKSTFTMTAKPNEPVALSQISLYKASDVPALLNLEAAAY